MSNPYCTIEQLYYRYDQRVLAQLSNDNGSRISVDDSLNSILDDAAAELESHLNGRYGLPLPSVPTVLTRWVSAMAAQRLYTRRADCPAAIKADADWAEKWIENLELGKTSLVNIARSNQPTLIASESKHGKSRFDHVPFFDRPPSPTSTGRGI